MLEKVVLSEAFAKFSDTWSPKVAGDVNEMQIKLARFSGDFVWHDHETEDELFLVVKGALTMKLRDGDVELGPGEFIIVPRGVEHCPSATEGTEVILLEPKSTVNTGAVESDLTVRDLDHLDQL